MVATAKNRPEFEKREDSAKPTAMFEKSGKVEPAMIATLRDNPWQPRHEIDPAELEPLKQSIRDFGFIGYIPVRRSDNSDPLSPLEIVYGHRRVKAAAQLGHLTVPVMMHRVSDEGMMRLAYVENATQKKMTYWEEAVHFAQMQQTLNLSIRKLADMLGTSRGYVYNRLQLLDLPEGSVLQRAAKSGEIPMTSALIFMNLAKTLDQAQLDLLIEDIRSGELNYDDLMLLQKALAEATVSDGQLNEEGRRVHLATLVQQTRQRDLAKPVAETPTVPMPTADRLQDARWQQIARQAEQAQQQWDAIADDLPAGPAPERIGAIPLRDLIADTAPAASLAVPVETLAEPPTADHRPIRFESSQFAKVTAADHARRAITQLDGFLPHLRRSVGQADFSALNAQEFTDLNRLLAEMREELDVIAKGLHG